MKRVGSGSSPIEAIYRTLFDAILAQELLPGAKLSEETIGSFFGVSRTVVRAALNRLHSESLVDLKKNRGAFVAQPTREESRQVFEARICIEREIASRLAQSIVDDQITELDTHVAREQAAIDAGDQAAALRLSGQFHLLTAGMAGNDVLANILGGLISRTSLILALHGRHQESAHSLDEHRGIIEALRTRDVGRATQAMTRHLEDVIQRINLDQPKRTEPRLVEILARHVS